MSNCSGAVQEAVYRRHRDNRRVEEDDRPYPDRFWWRAPERRAEAPQGVVDLLVQPERHFSFPVSFCY